MNPIFTPGQANNNSNFKYKTSLCRHYLGNLKLIIKIYKYSFIY